MPPFLFGLLVTIAVETPIVAALFPSQRKRMALAGVLATTATNVLMNTQLPRWLGVGMVFLLVGEMAATLVEALVYALVSRPRDAARALVASSLANAASFAAGLVLPPTIGR